MLEVFGNIWDFHAQKEVVFIPTNGVVNDIGENIMGVGVAKQAADLFPDLKRRLGIRIQKFGNRCHYFHDIRVGSFPTKWHFREDSNLNLIRKSATELVEYHSQIFHNPEAYDFVDEDKKIYLVRPGCGYGNLSWESEVKPVLKNILDDKFIIVERY